MEQSNAIRIPFSKSRLALMLIGAIIFVALGIWFLTDAFGSNTLLGNRIIKVAVGLAGVLFFSWVGYFISKKLFDGRPALIISDQGIVDQSSGTCAGFVSWAEVLEIKEVRISGQVFINLVVRDPEIYIERQESTFRRRLMRANLKRFGTAIGISANGLQCSHRKLKLLLDARFLEYKIANT
jgi:uncharacterized membrane protein YuzA (DUF378 family)